MDDTVSNFGASRLHKLRYLLHSGSMADPATAPLHNSAFRLWQKSWRQTFAELRSEAVPRADDFTRQSVIGALFYRDEAVGLLLHTYFNLDLEATRAHSYLSTYPPSVVDKLRSEGIKEVFSMEYLTLDPNWRRNLVGVPLGEVLLGLGVKLAENSGLAAMLVVTRNEKRVNDILYGFGARCLAKDLTKHNVAVDLVSLDRGKTHPGPREEVNSWISHFWGKREDLAQFAKTTRLTAA